MISFKAVNPTDEKVMVLIQELNDYQISLYGKENCNLETPDSLAQHQAYMIGAFSVDILVGIGAIKIFDTYAEIKRMYVNAAFRGLSIAQTILVTLESYAQSKGIKRVCLETGYLHHAALLFYRKQGYREIESFGDYIPNAVSVYLAKSI